MKRFMCLLIVCMLVMTACGVTNKGRVTTTSETTEIQLSDEEIYQGFLVKLHKKLQNIVGDDTHLDGFDLQEGMLGLNEIAMQFRLNLLNTTGYAFCDINNDGRTELLICAVDELTENTCVGTRILCAYTIADNDTLLLLEGSESQQYYLIDNATIYYEGYTDSSCQCFGTFELGNDGRALSCQDFYFVDLSNQEDKQYHFNHNGQPDCATSETFTGGESAFWKVKEELSYGKQVIELVPFAAFEA